MRPGTKVYASRIIFAVIAGVLSSIINPIILKVEHHGIMASFLPILIAVLLYMASYRFVKDIIKVNPSSLNDPSYIYKGGIFTYILVWIVTWSIVATLCCPSLVQ